MFEFSLHLRLMVSYNAPEVHILIEDERNIVVPTYYGNVSTTEGSNTGQRDQITAKTELQIKKPKIGLPLMDENGTIISRGQFLWK